MAASTTDRNTKIRTVPIPRLSIGKVAAATNIPRGVLVATNAAGFLVNASDVAAILVVGMSDEAVDNTAGIAGAVEINYLAGVVAKFANFGADPVVQADMHRICRVADNQTVRNAGGTADIPAGTVQLIESDGVWLYIDSLVGLAVA